MQTLRYITPQVKNSSPPALLSKQSHSPSNLPFQTPTHDTKNNRWIYTFNGLCVKNAFKYSHLLSISSRANQRCADTHRACQLLQSCTQIEITMVLSITPIGNVKYVWWMNVSTGVNEHDGIQSLHHTLEHSWIIDSRTWYWRGRYYNNYTSYTQV